MPQSVLHQNPPSLSPQMMTRSQKAMRPQPRTVWSTSVGRVCQNPPVVDNVSGRSPALISFHPEIIHKDIRSERRLAQSSNSRMQISVRLALLFGVRGRERRQNCLLPKESIAEHQRHKGLRAAIATDLANLFFSRPTCRVCGPLEFDLRFAC